MRRLGTIAMVMMMTSALAGCGGGGDDGGADDEPASGAAATTTVPVPSTAGGTTVPATNLTLKITDLRLVNSEESDNGVRVLLPAGVATASVTVTGLPSPNRVVSVCQARQLDTRLSGAACRTPTNGEAMTVTLGTAAAGVEIVQVGTTGSGAAGSTVALEEVTIRYAASSREVNIRLPQIAAGETGGRPSFGLTPPSADGTYRASLSWTVIQVFGGTPSNGQLELVQGGTVAGQAQGGSGGVQLTGKVTPPVGEAAIRIRNSGEAALVTPKLSVLLP